MEQLKLFPVNHLMFTVNSGDKDFIIFNAETLTDEPVTESDLRFMELQNINALQSMAWSSNVKWFFVIQPFGMFLCNISNGKTIFCKKKSNLFIEMFLSNKT